MTWRKIMTETELIKEYIETLDGAITYDGCDSALIGTAKIYREEQFVEVAMYSYELLVEHFKNEYLSPFLLNSISTFFSNESAFAD